MIDFDIGEWIQNNRRPLSEEDFPAENKIPQVKENSSQIKLNIAGFDMAKGSSKSIWQIVSIDRVVGGDALNSDGNVVSGTYTTIGYGPIDPDTPIDLNLVERLGIKAEADDPLTPELRKEIEKEMSEEFLGRWVGKYSGVDHTTDGVNAEPPCKHSERIFIAPTVRKCVSCDAVIEVNPDDRLTELCAALPFISQEQKSVLFKKWGGKKYGGYYEIDSDHLDLIISNKAIPGIPKDAVYVGADIDFRTDIYRIKVWGREFPRVHENECYPRIDYML